MPFIHGYNDPMYNAHKNMGAHYTQQNTVIYTFGKQGEGMAKLLQWHMKGIYSR